MADIILIGAHGNNGVVGVGGKLPWQLPTDLKMFKALTSNHTVIMGRKTFDSLGRKPLPNRSNIVITSQQEGVCVENGAKFLCLGFDEALEYIADHLASNDADVFVIGGTKVWEKFIPHADGAVITHVDCEVEGDAHFPIDALLESNLKLIETTPLIQEEGDEYSFKVKVYENKKV